MSPDCHACIHRSGRDCKFHKNVCTANAVCFNGLTLSERNELMIKHLGFVFKEAHKIRSKGYSTEDLVQDGIEGLEIALRKYDKRLGYSFGTYAVWWIRQRMIRAFRGFKNSIVVPVWYQDALQKLKKLDKALGHAPSRAEKRNYLGKRLEKFEEININTVAIDNVNEDTSICQYDCHRSAEALLDDRIVVARMLNVLKLQEQEVIKLRFGFDNMERETLEVIGKRYGVTRERVRQIEKCALGKLRRAFQRAGICN